MKMFSQNSRFTKILSLTIVSALLMNDAIACSLALDRIDFMDNHSQYSVGVFFNDDIDENNKVDVSPEIESIEAQLAVSNVTAVSGGPGQSEIVGSTANSSGGLVSSFTGDLAYSIPLMSVEGFPITMSYDPNIGMDQEASWVGLGWNLSLGAINREMRGIPDDFQGDRIERILKMKDNTRNGSGRSLNLFTNLLSMLVSNVSGNTVVSKGLSAIVPNGITFSRGNYFDNYTGKGKTRSFGLSRSWNLPVPGNAMNVAYSMSLGFSTDSQNGRGSSLNKSFSADASASYKSVGLFGSYSNNRTFNSNSRTGVKTMNFNSGFSVGFNMLPQVKDFSSNKNISIADVGYSYGSSRGSMRTFGVQTYVPRIESSRSGFGVFSIRSFNVSSQLGPLSVGLGAGSNSNSSTNSILNFTTSHPSYGYQNHSKGEGNNQAILDYNRDRNKAVSSETKVLPFSAQTFDMYHCSAPGLNSVYRPYRYDVVEYHDPSVASRMTNQSNEIEERNIHVGFAAGVLSSAGYTQTDQTSDGLTEQITEGAMQNANFEGINTVETFNRKEYYLKTQGETKPIDETLINSFGSLEPSRLGIQYNPSTDAAELTNILQSGFNASISSSLPTNNKSVYRSKNSVHYRERLFSEIEIPTLIGEEVVLYGGIPTLTEKSIDFSTDEKKSHHTGAIEVVDEGGMRYVFGIPVYSYSQSEVAFSASLLLDNIDFNRTSLLRYEDGDNSINNSKGRAAAFEKTTTPAYASSYLLTEMLSSDYIDRTNDGVSPDDQGNYYKLNYVNPYEGDGNKEDIWKWRMPMCSNYSTDPNGLGFEYEKNLAFANKNSHTDKWDDMANYMYGEKEVWYAGTIESKNMIAFFCLEDRDDQFSAIDENGGLDLTKPGKRLKKIMLFSKNDLETKESNAKALQIVEFEYDYRLCKKYVGNKKTYDTGVDPNTDVDNETGKLTLKRILTYTGTSKEGKTLPIEFEYGSDSINNPSFAFNSTDRWGNYKPNDTGKPNHEFPYVVQDDIAQTDNVQAWKLKAVNVVGGARTEFNYESDDYAFVQDQRAMRMFNVVGMSSTSELQEISSGQFAVPLIDEASFNNINGGNHHHFRNPGSKKDHYNVMYFEFENPIDATITNLPEEVKNQYFKDEQGEIPDEIYFKMYSRLDNRTDVPDEGFEFVESTVKLGKLYNNGNFCGVAGLPDNGSYKYGYIIMQPEDINQFKDKSSDKFKIAFQVALSNFLYLLGINISYKVNPLQVANWQYARLNAPCNVYGDINYAATVPTEFCDYHLENDGNIFGSSLYKRLNKKGYGMQFMPSKSVMRLFEPDNKKLGGRCRISSVTVHDNWDTYSGESNASYTYNYDYSESNIASSGVASYEPQVGNNENPFYQFTTYDYKRNLLPDERVYQKDPWGELVFPGAMIGYSKVSSGLFNGDILGTVVEEFWTLREKPTITKRTPILVVKSPSTNNKKFKDLLNATDYVKEVYGFSQGFYVETSDYHGKPKRTKVYGKDNNGALGELISTSEIEYYDFSNDQINYVNNQGGINTSNSPRDVDMHADSWRSYSSNWEERIGRTFSVGFGLVAGFPVPIIRKKESEDYVFYENEAKAYTFNKVIHNYAMPKAIHTSYLGSKNTARNLYFDEATGDVLVSSLKDEFDDELYSMSYPAHWYHDEFKNMSETDGMLVPNQSFVDLAPNSIRLYNDKKLYVGDHLEIHDGLNVVNAWVLNIDDYIDPDFPCHSEIYNLIDEDGVKLNGIDWPYAWFRVERTGVKNVTSAQMASVVTKSFPPQGGNGSAFVFPATDILSSSAVKFVENKNVPCVPFDDEANAQNYPSAQLVSGDTINPFLQGTKGNLRMLSSFAFQEERDESDVNTIRKNAPLVNYEPFYSMTPCGWRAIDETEHPDNLASGDFNQWRKLGEINSFDEFGKPLQSTDQISISSTVQYGMNKDLKLVQKAQAVNAKATEIGFDGFEEYNYLQNNTINYVDYGFSLNPTTGGQIVSDKRHSGKYALKVDSGVSFDFRVEKPTSPAVNIVNHEYIVQDCNCLQGFALVPGEEYLVSTWVHENTKVYPFTQSIVQIEFFDAGNVSIGAETFFPSGAVIDGWQKIEGKYVLPTNTASIRINLGTNVGAYYDDFRIHPYLAGMTTTVYDQTTLLPIAQHDGYNYTTFYNYDENNQLVRVRVETTEGIKTISESEMGSYRKQ